MHSFGRCRRALEMTSPFHSLPWLGCFLTETRAVAREDNRFFLITLAFPCRSVPPSRCTVSDDTLVCWHLWTMATSWHPALATCKIKTIFLASFNFLLGFSFSLAWLFKNRFRLFQNRRHPINSVGCNWDSVISLPRDSSHLRFEMSPLSEITKIFFAKSKWNVEIIN